MLTKDDLTQEIRQSTVYTSTARNSRPFTQLSRGVLEFGFFLFGICMESGNCTTSEHLRGSEGPYFAPFWGVFSAGPTAKLPRAGFSIPPHARNVLKDAQLATVLRPDPAGPCRQDPEPIPSRIIGGRSRTSVDSRASGFLRPSSRLVWPWQIPPGRRSARFRDKEESIDNSGIPRCRIIYH
jgi:hypothetical protein